ncbi:MAG: creatininase family protein [Clostridia bacterium]|nr:creatininase family protein [Clostridia bacterium]
MFLSHMTWPQVEAYFKKNDAVLLSVGSIECHGRHLPLGTDTLVPDHLLKTIDEKSDILIAPTIPYGACDSLKEYPGTINLGIDLLYRLLKQITDELYRHGARHFVILNGHGGNCRTIDQIGFDLQRRGALLAELNWWLMAWDMNPAWKGGHGGGEETAAIMGIDPSLVDKSEFGGPLKFKHLTPNIETTGFLSSVYKGVTINIPRVTNTITDSGWIGPDHPSTATEEWGREMLKATADYIVDFIGEFKKAKLGIQEDI